MADRAKRITDLSALTTPASTDLLIIEDDPSGNSVTKKITVSNILNSNLINTAALSFGTANATTASTVRLIDSVTNTSIIMAATANSVKTAYDSAAAAYTNAVAAAATYTDTEAANAFTSAIGIAAADASSKAETAYTNSVAYVANADVVSANVLIAANVISEPANSSSSGTAGEIRIANDHIYVCIATDTWKRVSIADWP